MKLTVFQSDKGDCLLLTSADGKRRILVDGGMSTAYRKFVAPSLGNLAADDLALDLVYISHIDQDHISGVLRLLDDMVAWRVHDFQVNDNDNAGHPKPDSPRPPVVRDIWHNAFHESEAANVGAIGDLLAATAPILSGAIDRGLLDAAALQRELATSIPEGIKVSRRVSADQLGIPLNRHFGGKLAFVRTNAAPPDPIRLGALKIHVIGPFDADLAALRKKWDEFLRNSQEDLLKLQKQAQRDAERLGTNDAGALLELRLAQAQQLGDRDKVTPPNLASLMLLVEEGAKTVLLTGDGHADDIIKGLDFHRKLNAAGQIHVDVLKVQHHGAEFNLDENFVSKVSADHYVFCGNGEHENPDLRVLNAVIDARLKDVAFRATHPKAAGDFTLWFNSSESATKAAAKEHMRKVVELVQRRAVESQGRMTAKFLADATPAFELAV